ncbi:hypothetical protein SAMN05421853_110105 [Roseivivax halotolerans]|uniref:Uncharacterized protein n=1 Tax=Roseivivax halotolerans TaxID=93684 RepID=A0A1I5ZJJ8_9RHOB|nr:hypothetical protein [Roseivivax halotolerans]SFQ56631.1 hypothetical protein SAMN05421853_110105 [Roseivivax halotolerans]
MSRLGIYADKINAIRKQRGLTPSGFREDGTDALKSDKEAMERAMYERADARLPPGNGGPTPSSDSKTEGTDESSSDED